MNTFNENRNDETDELSAVLNDLPEVDPPAALVDTVMSSVRQSATHTHQPRVQYMRSGSTMAKKVLWSVAAAAAAALVVMRVAGYPPVEKGTEATIGAAQRYQAPQVAAADVKVEDQQLQAFLQSDTFRKLAADKAAQQALKNKDFQKALADPKVRTALLAPGVVNVIAMLKPDVAFHAGALDVKALDLTSLDAGARDALQVAFEASPSFVSALLVPGIVQAFSESSLGAVLASPNVAMLVHPAVMNALATGLAPSAIVH